MKGKEVTKEPVTQNEHKDIAIGMEFEWIKKKNRKAIYELVAQRVGSPTVAKQVNIKPCSWSDKTYMMLEMEYLYPLMPNLKAYYLLYRLPMSFRLGIVLSMLSVHIIKK